MQANKEVTVNEAINLIDHLLFRTITQISETLPENPAEGELVLLESLTELTLALFCNNSWHTFEPKKGWIIYCLPLKNFLYFDGQGYSKILP